MHHQKFDTYYQASAPLPAFLQRDAEALKDRRKVRTNGTIQTLAVGITVGAVIVLGSVISASAQEVLNTGENEWVMETPVAPAACSLEVPTVTAQFTYDLVADRWEVVTPGQAVFAVNNVTTVAAETTGEITVNGTPHPTVIPSYALRPWTIIQTDAGDTVFSSAVQISTPDKDPGMIVDNRVEIPVPTGATEITWSIGLDSWVVPPTDLTLRNGDVIAMSFTLECIS